jgi:hypothetical protein
MSNERSTEEELEVDLARSQAVSDCLKQTHRGLQKAEVPLGLSLTCIVVHY